MGKVCASLSEVLADAACDIHQRPREGSVGQLRHPGFWGLVFRAKYTGTGLWVSCPMGHGAQN